MSEQSSVSRRAVLSGIAAVAATPLLGQAASAAVPKQRRVIAGTAKSSNNSRLRFNQAIVTLADGRVLVSGGYHHVPDSDRVMPSSSVQIYDPATGLWVDVAPLKTARAQHAAVSLPDGRVAVLGGISHIALSSVEIYNPMTNTWSVGKPLNQPIFGHSASQTGSLIAISGGQNGIPIQFYDPQLVTKTGY